MKLLPSAWCTLLSLSLPIGVLLSVWPRADYIGGGRAQLLPNAPAPPPTGSLPRPAPSPYTTIMPPNPGLPRTAMLIMPATQLTPVQCISLARFASTQDGTSRNWKELQVFVATDANTARTLDSYLSRRRGAALDSNDARTLADSWRDVPVCLITKGGRTYVLQPAQAPKEWWKKLPG